MKINKDTWHYKLWRKSFVLEESIPEKTDLCRYCHKVFWQVVGRGVLIAVLLVSAATILIGLFMLAYHGFWFHPIPTLIGVGVVVVAIILITLYGRWLNNKTVRKFSNDNLVSHWLAAKKQNVCSLVEFSDEEESS